MPIDSLAGRQMLVLGGSNGIGYAVAEYLLRAGAVLTISGRNEINLEAARQRLLSESGADEANLRATTADARDLGSVRAVVAFAADQAGELDGLFVTAGGSGWRPVAEMTTDALAEEWANNMFPVANAITASVPVMKRKGGSVVALSTVAAIQSLQGLSGYNAAKAGVEQYIRTAADELGQYRIRINAVRPGLTKTGLIGDELDSPVYKERFERHTPLGYYGVPEDFGAMVSLLMSAETRWITGQIFSIDGGLSIRGYGGEGLATD